LSPESAPPELAKRIYPSLSPIQEAGQGSARGARFFLSMIIVLAGLVLVALVLVTLFIALRSRV
jgi:hypothetical protein